MHFDKASGAMWVDSSVWSNKMVRFPHATVVRGLSSCLLPTWGLPKPPISQQNSPNKLKKKHKQVIVSCQVGELNGFIMSYKESQSWLVGEARGPAVSRRQSLGGSGSTTSRHTCIPNTGLSVVFQVDIHTYAGIYAHTLPHQFPFRLDLKQYSNLSSFFRAGKMQCNLQCSLFK